MSKRKVKDPFVDRSDIDTGIGDWVVRPTAEITVQDIVAAIADDYGDEGLVNVINHMFDALDGDLQEEVVAGLQLKMKPS